MNYIIIESQTSNGSTAVVAPIPVYSDAIEAEAVFLEKCAYARRSGLDCHTVVLMDEEGKQLARKTFKK
jgi:hypothetical protein